MYTIYYRPWPPGCRASSGRIPRSLSGRRRSGLSGRALAITIRRNEMLSHNGPTDHSKRKK
eukprot:11025422-Heterocapsa_arctica.AAC.1